MNYTINMKKGTISILVLLIVLSKINAQSIDIKYADSLFFLGNYSKAIEVYKKNNQVTAYEKIAEAYMGIGNYDLSLEYYKKCIASKPNNIIVKYKYGKLLSKTRKDNKALKVFNELIEQNNHNPNYYYELGLILEHQQKPEALQKFEIVFKIDSTHQKAIHKLAKHHLLKKHYDSVNFYSDAGLKLYVNNKNLISLKAQNFYRQKKYQESIKYFDKLLELNEQNQFIFERLSSCYSKINKPFFAIKYSLLALGFDKSDVDNLNTLGELYLEVGEYKKAEIFLKESISRMNVSLDQKLVRLGYAQHQQENYIEAVKSFKKALKENTNNEEALFYLAYSKDKYYKDLNAKIIEYEKFRKKFPNSKFKSTVDFRLKRLKKERFIKADIK